MADGLNSKCRRKEPVVLVENFGSANRVGFIDNFVLAARAAAHYGAATLRPELITQKIVAGYAHSDGIVQLLVRNWCQLIGTLCTEYLSAAPENSGEKNFQFRY